MIKNEKPLSMAEASEYAKEDSVKTFITKFTKMKPEKAKKLRENIEKLDNLKINPKHISKIIDILPSNKESLNKILNDVNLDENETNAILSTIKETI